MSDVNIGPKIVLEGEKEYRTAINNVNKDMKVLTSEMKAASAEFDGNANSIIALTKKSEILNKEYENQTLKVRTLQGALENAKVQYGENSNQVKEWQVKLNNASAELSGLDKELKANDRYLDEAKASMNGTADSIDRFGKEVKSTGESTLKTGDIIKANLTSAAIIGGVQQLGSAIGNAATKSIDLVTQTAAYADNMLTASTQTGISTDKLQAYNYMAELTDTSMETLTGSMAKNIKSMTNAQNGSEKYTEAYKKLGVQVTDSNGKLKNSEDVYWNVIDALKGITDETERDSISMQLFGKSAQELNPIISQGSAGVKKFTEEAQKMGAILDEDTLNSLGATDDAFQRMYQSVDIAERKFGAEMAPAVTSAVEKVTEKITDMDGELAHLAGGALEAVTDGFVWILDNSDLVIAGLSGIAAGMITQASVGVITSAVGAFETLSTAIKGAAVAQEALNVAQRANAIGLLVTAVAGLGTALVVYNKTHSKTTAEFDALQEKINSVREENKKFAEEINDSNKNYETSTDEIKNNYGAIQVLSDKLYSLADKENKSNSEKAHMQSIVNQLNESIPDLNLVLDMQTGILSKQKDEVDGLVKSMKEKAIAQAYEGRYLELANEQVTAQENLTKAIEAQKKAQEDYNASSQKYLEELDKHQKGDSWKGIYNSIDNMELYQKKLESANTEIETSKKLLDESKTKFNEFDKQVGITGDSTSKYADTVTDANNQVKAALQESKKAYDDSKKAAIESIQGQIDIFDKFTKSSKVTKDELLKNLKSQVEGVSEWANNLKSLSNRGINEGLLKDLKDMGPSAAAEIAALNAMSDKELKEYSKTWEKLGKETKKGADILVSDTKDVYEKAYKEEQRSAAKAGKEVAESHISGAKSSENQVAVTWRDVFINSLQYANDGTKQKSKSVGASIADGIGEGVNSKKSSLGTVMSGLATSMLFTLKSKLEIHSPSKVFKDEVGVQIAQGVIDGVDSKKENAKKSASELGEILLDAAKTKLNNYKVYNDLSLSQEVEYWNEIRKETKKGTQARIDADEEYYTAKKSLLEKQTDIERTYKENVKKINDDLKANVQETINSYTDAVETRAKSITDSMGLFDAFSSKSDLTGTDLLNNLKSQVVGINDWRKSLRDLENRGVDSGLIDELQQMGVDASGQISALNTLTDDQLNEYVELWRSKSESATKEAVHELEGLKDETSKKIKELTKQANKDLKEYYKTYSANLKELGLTVKTDSKTVGENIANGIESGLNSKKSSLNASMKNLANSLLTTFKSTLDIHSPSKVFAEQAGWIPEGVAKGITENAVVATDAMQSLSNSLSLDGTASKLSGNILSTMSTVAKDTNINNAALSANDIVTTNIGYTSLNETDIYNVIASVANDVLVPALSKIGFNISLQGDAKNLFRVYRKEDAKNILITGNN